MPQQKRRITAEDLYQFQLILDARISPDGQNVVYTVQRVDPKTEEKYSNLWIVPTNQAEPRQFTYGDQKDISPRWSPDGKQIAFLSNRADKEKPAQVYMIPFYGGEARPLTQIDGTIGEFSWSPDGKYLLCKVRKTDPDELERQKDEQKRELGVVQRQYDRVFYKLDGYGYLPKERWHLWIVDTDTGNATQLTDHPVYDELYPAWSPDAQWIAFISNDTKSPDLNPDVMDLFVISVKGGPARKIKTPVGPKLSPSFSPDGQVIAYYASEGEGLSYKNVGVWIVPMDGSDQARNLTEKFDLNASAMTINDMGQPETMPPAWSIDSNSIYFPVTYHGSSVLNSITVDGKSLKTIIGKGGVVGCFSFDCDQQRLAYFWGKMDDPGQIHILDLKTGEDRQLTQVNRDLLGSLDLGQIEEVWFKGAAGNDLQGWILKPPDFDPAKKYPSILEIHGGPVTQYGNFFMHEFYYLASKGYVVYFSNPRGGRGYGEEHAKAIYKNWGGPDYEDLMAWTDFISQKPYIDTGRMGVTGGSYGGYMTVWIIGHTRRFKAAVTQRCVSNFISMWGSSDFNWSFQYELSDKPPFESLQDYWDHSPIKYIGNTKTPTMVIHNEMDLRCPIEQGEQVFVALQRLGVESEMIRFPDEFHGLSRTGRTDRRIARLNHILRWFDNHIK
jgi:dipeptidyl aminopeptidase/acylaminoacyl peptidase